MVDADVHTELLPVVNDLPVWLLLLVLPDVKPQHLVTA